MDLGASLQLYLLLVTNQYHISELEYSSPFSRSTSPSLSHVLRFPFFIRIPYASLSHVISIPITIGIPYTSLVS